MQRNGSAGALVFSALVLGAAILGASYLLKGSAEEVVAELAGLREAVSELELAAPPAPPSRRAERAQRPDPSRRYEVEVGAAPVKGPPDAPVTIVEWSDFQCPFCQRVTPTLEQIEREYGDQVRIAFKHMPLSMHPKAPAAHAAAEAAHRQGKFWEMHDRIFGNQREMSPEKYEEYAAEIGLDLEQFVKDRDSAEVRNQIDADAKLAGTLGVTGTPAFFVNGRFLSGAQPLEAFKQLIDAELAKGGEAAENS